jgi:effector-binding domain-containing protein
MPEPSGNKPVVVHRPAQPYAGIRQRIRVENFGMLADRLPELFAWLAERGVEPAGAPFFKFNVIGPMKEELEAEAGVPVVEAVPGEGAVFSGVLPAGLYAIVTHIGHPERLPDVTDRLLEWAARQGLAWDMTETAGVQVWGCRLEIYRTDPRLEPDMDRWETELAFKLAD